MAFAKTEEFDVEIIDMAEFASALSHPARIAIITFLLENPGARCGSLVDFLPLSQPSCSRHLGELRKAKLVEAKPKGSEVRYFLKMERINHFCEAFRTSLNPPSC